jgi:hypothetical protein
MAFKYKSRFFGAKDSTEFIQNLENNNHIKINKFSISGKDNISNMTQENINYSRELNPQGDFLYINPMVITHLDKNPFTQSERKLPIEFDFPHSFVINSIIEIPQNYKVEELPKSIKISLPDNAGICVYQITQDQNNIQFNYRFSLNQTIFPQSSYNYIREFYAQVATKNSELIVLKKIN